MLLAIDIGNTNITLGLWQNGAWQHQWRLRTIHDMTVDEYGVYLNSLLRENSIQESTPSYKLDISAAIMSSVVPALTTTFTNVCRHYLKLEPLQVSAGTKTGVPILTENPSEVGADRIVNAAAAHHKYKGAAIVVDMGTATTFDAVTAAGELLGVTIAPGLGLAAAALSNRAAQLSRVSLEAPPRTIGRNTIHAMQSGLIYGYVSLIEGMVRRIKNEMGDEEISVIGTGGHISIIASHTDIIDHVDPWLTLNGLLVIHTMNEKKL